MGSITDRSERPSLVRLGRVEARKMVDTRAAMWLLILTALSAVGSIVVNVLGAGPNQRDLGELFTDAMIAAAILMPIVPILLVTGEWSQRTALTTFTLVPARQRVMAAKLLALLALLAAFTVLCLALAALGAAIGGGGFEIPTAEAAQAVLAGLLALLFGFGLAAILMSSPAAIVLNFAAPILVAAIAAISTDVESAVAWVDPYSWSTLNDARHPDWDEIATTTLVWVVVPIVLGLVRLRRRDVS